LRTLPYREHCGIAYALTLYAGVHQGALPEKWSAEQEGLAWKLATDLLKAYSETGKFNDGKAIQALLSWTGSVGLFGWGSLRRELDGSVRGPMAYVLGHRMVRLGQPADARKMFQTAWDDAAAGSALRRMARAELDRLKAK
jgi:hypothetical protein